MQLSKATFLVQLRDELHQVRERVEQLREILSDEQLVWQPEPRKWSVAQCFEHLRRVDAGYVRTLQEAFTRERTSGDSRPYRPSLMGMLFLYASAPEPRIRVPTPPRARPKPIPVEDGHRALERFLEQQTEVVDLVRRAAAFDLNAIRVRSPMSRLVRFTLGDALAILVAHEQRHLGQAQRVTQHPDFPRG